jgi:hypothetical protein
MESKLESSSMSINDRLDTLEKSFKSVLNNSSTTESELAKLHALFSEFGVSVKASNQSLQEKMQNELSILSSKIDRQEQKILNDKSIPTSTRSEEIGGPSFFTVNLLTLIENMCSDFALIMNDFFSNFFRCLWWCFWLV